MDALRLAVAPVAANAGGGFQVEIYVNDVEVTSRGAGLGMDPYDVLVPVNRFVARDQPQLVPVARCGCGVYGCGMTAASIARQAGQVVWDWDAEVPMTRAVVFDAREYDREVHRASEDHSWETAERTAGRLILSSIGIADLPGGLRFDWVGNDWRDSTRFEVCLQIPGTHQIFVSFEWGEKSPEVLASEVRRMLTTQPPDQWPAAWHSIEPQGGPPALAGSRWTQRRV